MIKLPWQRVHGVSVLRSCFLLEQARYISATAPLRPCYKLRNNSSLRRAKAQEWLRVYKGGLRDVLGEGVYVQMKQGVHFPGMRVKFCPTSYQTNTKQTVPLSLHLFSRTIVHWWLSRTSVFRNGSDFRRWGQNIPHVQVYFSPRRRRSCFSQTTLLPGLCVHRRRSISSVFTNKFLLTTASLYSRRFSGSEIISNGRFNTLNTWRHCVNNRNISVEEKRSLWSPQPCLQLVSTLQNVNLPNCWNLEPSSSVFFNGFSVVYQLFPSRIKLLSTTHKFRQTAKVILFLEET